MITVYTSNSTIELAEVKYIKCTLIDSNGNECMVFDYFGKTGRIQFIYIDDIIKIDIDIEKERLGVSNLRGF
ncbi:MAG: hypothetical protein K0S25_2122 [Bacillus sp. (in: firmicutes)]|nr:hypothetical protein [Bacillus sp. (in: firmicutes)]